MTARSLEENTVDVKEGTTNIESQVCTKLTSKTTERYWYCRRFANFVLTMSKFGNTLQSIFIVGFDTKLNSRSKSLISHRNSDFFFITNLFLIWGIL